jgi:hypothetical protein
MQAMQTQAQAPPSGGDFATMPLWTRGDAVSSSSDERAALALDLETILAVLNEGTIPSGRNGNTGGGRGSSDRPTKRNDPHNSPSEPSAQ